MEQLSQKYKNVATYHDNNHLPFLWGKHRAHRTAIFKLLDLMDIKSSSQDHTLLDLFEFVKMHKDSRKESLQMYPDIDFLSKRWKALVMVKVDGRMSIKRRELEVCTLSHMADALRSGNLYITGSEGFADIGKQLLPWEDCLSHLEEYCSDMDLPATAEGFVEGLRKNFIKPVRKPTVCSRKTQNSPLTPMGRCI